MLLWECMILEPFMKLQSHFKDTLESHMDYIDCEGEVKEQKFQLGYMTKINMTFLSKQKGSLKVKKLSEKIL